MTDTKISFIGYGEAAQALTQGWGRAPNREIRCFDLKTTEPVHQAAQWAVYHDNAVTGCETLAESLTDTSIVFSLVTADQARHVAEAAATTLPSGCLYLDGNSCAPSAKKHAAAAIEAVSGRYVDLAIMAPIHPKKHLTPMLVSGPHTAAALEALVPLEMRPRSIEGPVGAASTIKMLRSVMVKGMEALFAEMVLAARRAGVDQEVLGSLQASTPGLQWEHNAGYALERMLVHGKRRAAEMVEVVKTLEDLGLSQTVSERTALWQDRLGNLEVDAGMVRTLSGYRALAELIENSSR